MEVLVTYDVATDTSEGRRRLRRVAKACESYCQRVQKSVFECTLNGPQLEVLKHRLNHEISLEEDSLRIYHLSEPRHRFLEVIGKQPQFDIHDPLVV